MIISRSTMFGDSMSGLVKIFSCCHFHYLVRCANKVNIERKHGTFLLQQRTLSWDRIIYQECQREGGWRILEPASCSPSKSRISWLLRWGKPGLAELADSPATGISPVSIVESRAENVTKTWLLEGRRKTSSRDDKCIGLIERALKPIFSIDSAFVHT